MLLESARQLMVKRQTTLRALVEEGLRLVLDSQERAAPFKLRDRTFKGKGLQPGFSHDHWAGQRDAAYEGRGA